MSPRTYKQNEEIREEKRTLIMDTALMHFANEGYHHTTISHIAGHAGISKGLMYNYFRSKDELLDAIINRSMADIFSHFDSDHDGILTEVEFDYFIRILCSHIKENRLFWLLFYQLLLQKDVREQFLRSWLDSSNSFQNLYTGNNNSFLGVFARMMHDYFLRKKERKPQDYDPVLDLNIFMYTLEGFTLVNSYLDKTDDYYDKSVNKIIEMFK